MESKIKPLRADGGELSRGRLREIADNPYGDEEKRWMAAVLLSRFEAKPLGYVDMTAVRQMHRGETDSASLFMSTLSTPVFDGPPVQMSKPINYEIDGIDMDCVRDRTRGSEDYCAGYVDGMEYAIGQLKRINTDSK